MREIANADIVTTAVGPTVLKFVAPTIAAALQARSADRGPLVVMACENAINATDVLAAHIREHCSDQEWAAIAAKAIFANTAVDRIVPAQAADAGLDVTVETYFEWAIESPPFGGRRAGDPGRHLGDRPGAVHRAKAVHRQHRSRDHRVSRAGPRDQQTVRCAGRHCRSAPRCKGVLAETKALLVAKHEFSEAAQQAYVDKILTRFANPHLPDTTERVGRQPLRKLSRHERLIGPAAELAERGSTPAAPAGHRRCGVAVRRARGPRKRRAATTAADPDTAAGHRTDHRADPGPPAVPAGSRRHRSTPRPLTRHLLLAHEPLALKRIRASCTAPSWRSSRAPRPAGIGTPSASPAIHQTSRSSTNSQGERSHDPVCV